MAKNTLFNMAKIPNSYIRKTVSVPKKGIAEQYHSNPLASFSYHAGTNGSSYSSRVGCGTLIHLPIGYGRLEDFAT